MNDPTAQTPAADDLARLRELRPAWHIRHSSEDHPGELGYIATRDNILITAENLVRLGDRIADADRSEPTPAALMTGPPGWNSGPMPELTAANLAAAVAHRGWAVEDRGDHLTAEYRTGTMLRVLAGRTPGELAAKIRDAESAMPGPAPADVLAAIAADHPEWSVDVADHGHGVTAIMGETHLWASSAEELSALLDVADRRPR